MKAPFKNIKASIILYSGLFALLLLTSVKSFSQTYTREAGIYQAYQYSEPVKIEGMNIYYLLNKNGVVLLAFGSSHSTAFSDPTNGIKSGRIATGSFFMSGDELTMSMKKGTGNTYWTFNSNDNSIRGTSITLKYIGSL